MIHRLLMSPILERVLYYGMLASPVLLIAAGYLLLISLGEHKTWTKWPTAARRPKS